MFFKYVSCIYILILGNNASNYLKETKDSLTPSLGSRPIRGCTFLFAMVIKLAACVKEKQNQKKKQKNNGCVEITIHIEILQWLQNPLYICAIIKK